MNITHLNNNRLKYLKLVTYETKEYSKKNF